VTSLPAARFCSGQEGDYTFTLNNPSTSFKWSREAVQGISNAAVSDQATSQLHEYLFNTTNAPVNVTYKFTYGINGCDSNPFNLTVTVNPNVYITSAPIDSACNGQSHVYNITSNISNATFNWSRVAIGGNPAVSGQTNPINDILTNSGSTPFNVVYTITPMANDCSGLPFTYTVKVSTIPATPTITSNSPVCTGKVIQLNTPAVSKAIYSWTGPNGFISSLRNPTIPDVTTANSGTYKLTIIVNECISPEATIDMLVDDKPVVDAGGPQKVCIGTTSVKLAGAVSGGATTGIWSTSGTGSFTPEADALTGNYIPSDADKASGSVTLTLSSTSKDNCDIATATTHITFGKVPGADAGPDQEICSQSPAQLAGQIFAPGGGKWSTSGTGIFSSANDVNAKYLASADDISKGSVVLTLTATAADSCYIPTDQMVLKFSLPPVVNAGGIRYVLKGNTITLNPTVNKNNVQYLWSPDIDISNITIKNPVITGDIDRVYTLTVTDSLGCVTTSQVSIIVSPELKVANTFTPNADGTNDFWNIAGLVAYENATVDVFDRYGQKVFHSVGYPNSWNGNLNNGGSPLPAGVYYYIIDTKVNNLVLSGSVTIIR
jgi:gliding motility-associated-like protein